MFERDHHKCVVCGADAEDAHHLMERRLWMDGGYHLDNGVSLCSEHHLMAEATTLSPDELRLAAGITRTLLPEHLDPKERYDKWGNVYVSEHERAHGELYTDPSVQKVIVGNFVGWVKHPRTYHVPFSPGATNDDRILDEIPWEGRECVITEKLDGEGTTMYRDHIHARSLDSGYHPSRTWVKNLHGKIAHEIPEGWRICGENLQAKHAIAYRDLPSYFFVHSIWDEDMCLSYEETLLWANLLGLEMVPLLWGPATWGDTDEPFDPQPKYSDEMEGWVARVTNAFPYRSFRYSVGKWVREGHVQEGTQNWMRQSIVPNLLN